MGRTPGQHPDEITNTTYTNPGGQPIGDVVDTAFTTVRDDN